MLPIYHQLGSLKLAYSLVRLAITFLLLILPTTLMGATLPILVSGFSKHASFQKRLSHFYGINTVGAACGTILTGFLLLPNIGLHGSLFLVLALNLTVGLAAWYVDGRLPPQTATSSVDLSAVAPLFRRPLSRGILTLLVVSMLAGCMGMVSQIGWTRLLTPLLGSSAYAFSIILMTFLTGIGGGSLVVSLIKGQRCWSYLSVFLAGSSLTIITSLYGINYYPSLIEALLAYVDAYPALLFPAHILVASLLMLVPTLFMGGALPLAITCFNRMIENRGQSVGRLYMCNTIGSVVGALSAGFLLLPLVGTRKTLIVASGIGLFALFLVWNTRPTTTAKRKFLIPGLFVCLYSLLLLGLPPINQARLNTGHFTRTGTNPGRTRSENPYLISSKDGISATVSVYRTADDTYLYLNGKTNATAKGDLPTQYLLGHLPLFLHPDPSCVYILGYGSGATARAVAAHSVERIDVTELEPAVVEADSYFRVSNDGVLNDPRVRVHIEDGRTFLRYRQRKYDVVISEPSNPWIEGISSLFTVDFYRMAKRRLASNGIFCQWIQSYDISNQTLSVIVRTLSEVFPHVEMFVSKGDFIVLASDNPLKGTWARFDRLFEDKDISATLGRIDITNPFELLLGYVYSLPRDEALFPTTIRNTDANLWLEYRAPIEMYLGARLSMRPVSFEKRLDGYRNTFFDDLSRNQVAVGVSRGVARLQPSTAKRIKAFVSVVEDTLIRDTLEAIHEQARHADQRFQARDAHREKFLFHFQRKDYIQAQPYIDKLASEYPENSEFLRYLGANYEKRGEYTKSKDAYMAALALNPNDFYAQAHLGLVQLQLGRRRAAAQSFKKAKAINPHLSFLRQFLQ
jgi:spermidine synthase